MDVIDDKVIYKNIKSIFIIINQIKTLFLEQFFLKKIKYEYLYLNLERIFEIFSKIPTKTGSKYIGQFGIASALTDFVSLYKKYADLNKILKITFQYYRTLVKIL